MAERLTFEHLQYLQPGGDPKVRLTYENLQYLHPGGAAQIRMSFVVMQYLYPLNPPTAFVPQTAVIG